jgi:hypothetical protein
MVTGRGDTVVTSERANARNCGGGDRDGGMTVRSSDIRERKLFFT